MPLQPLWVSLFGYLTRKTTKKDKKGRQAAKGTGIDAVHFNTTPLQKLLQGSLAAMEAQVEMHGLSPQRCNSAVALNQTSCQAGSAEPFCLTRGSGPIRCPGWLLAELQVFAITAAA